MLTEMAFENHCTTQRLLYHATLFRSRSLAKRYVMLPESCVTPRTKTVVTRTNMRDMIPLVDMKLYSLVALPFFVLILLAEHAVKQG